MRGARQLDMMTFLNVFRKVGGAFEVDDDGIRFWHPGGPLNAIALETDVHPGFQTDWQQPLVVALTQAAGLSIVHETVYESRLGFTSALNQMGATIQLYRECLGGMPCRFGQRNFLHSAVISGPAKLTGADLVIPDLRGGFSYLIAALAAWVSIGRNGSISPSAAVTDYNLQAITAAVIGGISLFGGRGSILGTLIGAMIVGVVSMGLNMLGADPQWKVFLTGVLIITAVAVDQWIRKVAG